MLPRHVRSDAVASLRRAIVEVYEELGRPALYSERPIELADDVEISATGLVLTKLLGRRPALHGLAVDEQIVAIVEDALGGPARLELTAAVIADRSRPFFRWHHHAGGIDEELHKRRGSRPIVTDLERIAAIVYLDPIGPTTGQLLLHPRGAPKGADDAGPWPEQVAVEGPAGTVALFDQRTYHAATVREAGGLRVFFGVWLAACDAPATERFDPTLGALLARDDLSPMMRRLIGDAR